MKSPKNLNYKNKNETQKLERKPLHRVFGLSGPYDSDYKTKSKGKPEKEHGRPYTRRNHGTRTRLQTTEFTTSSEKTETKPTQTWFTIQSPYHFQKNGTLERQGYTTTPGALPKKRKIFHTNEPTPTYVKKPATATTFIPSTPTPFSTSFPIPILCTPQYIECAQQPSNVPKFKFPTTTRPNVESLQPTKKPSKGSGDEKPFPSTTTPSKILKKNSKSRRITQRRRKRYNKTNNLIRTLEAKNSIKIKRTEKLCHKNFGFSASTKLTKQQNFNKHIKTTHTPQLSLPQNLAFHNLCKQNTLPPGTKELLGLNLKFCLSSNKIQDDINKTIIQMARTIRTKCYLKETNTHSNSDYDKQIYKKNLTWHPPPAPLQIEDKITEFEKALKKLHESMDKKRKHRQLSNLNPLQLSALQQLRQNKNIIIKPTDKNLGPAIMDSSEYIQKILKEHLLTSTYKQLSYQETKNTMECLKTFLKDLLSKHTNSLSKSELTYFQCSLKEHHRLPIFYGLPKVHKQPISLRPVVSTSGSLLAVFSTLIDFKMKKLISIVKSYVQNSINVINE